MFLRNDEHFIAMNTNADVGGWGLPFVSMKTPELKRLREECGITVALEQIYWHKAERGFGEYSWAMSDMQVQRCLDAGMRVIMAAPFSIMGMPPREWVGKYADGRPMNDILSYWCPEAEEYRYRFLETLVERYSGPDVTIALHEFLGGEQYLWNHPMFYDDHAIRSFQRKHGSGTRPADYHPPGPLEPQTKEWLREAVVQHNLLMQKALVGQHNEVWDCAQYNIALQSEANGNFARPDVIKAYRDEWPDATIWLLQYTYWGNGPDNAQRVDDLMEAYNCKTIVEANYCGGISTTTPLAIKGGFNWKNKEQWHGQIVSPLHPFGGQKELKPWMMEKMKWAVDTWNEARSE